MAWVAKCLAGARAGGRRVLINGHIPPPFWHADRYEAWTQMMAGPDARAVVATEYWGHIHAFSFYAPPPTPAPRVTLASGAAEVWQPHTVIGASITRYSKSNPAYQVSTVDANWTVADIRLRYATPFPPSPPLLLHANNASHAATAAHATATSAAASNDANGTINVTFVDAAQSVREYYGVPRLDTPSLYRFAMELQAPGDAGWKVFSARFGRYFEGGHAYGELELKWRLIVCALTSPGVNISCIL